MFYLIAMFLLQILDFPPTKQKSCENVNGLIENNVNKENGPAVLHVNVTHF